MPKRLYLYINSIDSVSYSQQKGMIPAVSLILNNSPSAYLAGSSSLCVGLTTTLSDITSGGAWSSSNTAIATVGSAGIVTGVSAGTAIISYTYASGVATKTLTVNTTPSAITGSLSICLGTTTLLGDATTGGTWESTNPIVATVGTSTGDVTPVSAGASSITYTLGGGCTAHATVTVSMPPTAISGVLSVCEGSTSELFDGITGGSWSSSNTVAATINTTGVVSGLAPGVTTITYLAGGCSVTALLTVLPPLPAITGAMNMCAGTTGTLSDGATGGTWSSGSTTVATIGTSSGIVTPVSPGTSTITYTATWGCSAHTTVTVSTSAPAIIGIMSACQGTTITLADATTGGTWESSNTSIATIGTSSGVVSGVSPGTSAVTYTLAGGCAATTTITVNAPPTPITGTLYVCIGSCAMLFDGVSGGTWTSSTSGVATVNSVTDQVCGIVAGTSVIAYSLGFGCTTSATVTVNGLPSAIGGILSLCEGTTTTLTETATGGTWSSSNTAVATVRSPASGTVTAGVTPGTSVITYTRGTGCPATAIVTVNPPPEAITGIMSACLGSTTVLADGTTGGTWSSSNPAVATISTTGVVSALAPGITTITYVAGGCSVTGLFTVLPPPLAIMGAVNLCTGMTGTLSDITTGGIWSSGNTAVATIGTSSGIVTPVSPGITTITYAVGVGCTANAYVTVNLSPSAVTGAMSACPGTTTTLGDATTGGTWASGSASVASTGLGSGIVTAVSSGLAMIMYTLGTGCTAYASVTVDLSPLAITGTMSVCLGTTTTLADATSGGVWSSGTTTVAIAGPGTGIITPVSLGTSNIAYTLSDGCAATLPVTVNPLPAAVTGTMEVCVGSTTTLSDAVSAGTWSSGSSAIASITAGTVTGVSGGTADITYTLAGGCLTSAAVTVNALPSPSIIVSGLTLNTAIPYASYQWLLSGAPISGATSATYTMSINGVYSVAVVDNNGCTATSGVTIITNVGVENINSVNEEIKVYPNPNEGTFTLMITSAVEEPALVTITNIVGEKVDEFKTTTNKEIPVDISNANHAAGMYFLSVITASGVHLEKISVK